MGLVSRIFRDTQDSGLLFWCPGCDGPHRIQYGEGSGPRWQWNGNLDLPVFTPSLLVTWSEPKNLHDPEAIRRDIAERDRRKALGEDWRIPQAEKRCHSFIGCSGANPGQIIFLSDCTHALRGQTVDLPPWPTKGDWA